MKRKIIALLMATVCTTAVFASCDGGESSSSSVEKPACETHVDANNDGTCDGCDKAVVVITEQLPAEKEEEVPMVVNPLPENVTMSDYIGPKADAVEEDAVFPTQTQEIAHKGWQDGLEYNRKNLHVLVTTEEDMDYDYSSNPEDPWREIESEVVKVYDDSKPYDKAVIFTKKTRLQYNYYRWSDDSTPQLARPELYDTEEIEERTRYSVTLQEDYAKVVESVREYEDGYLQTTYKTEYYTYGWNLIATAEETDTIAADASVVKYAGYTYLTIDDKTYILDDETGEQVDINGVSGVDKEMVIRRPAFDAVVEDYGYVIQANGFKVYDLTEWVSCVYNITFPSYWSNAKTVVLADGTVFVQYEKTLHSNAVSYDVKKDDKKIDLVQVLINPAEGTMETVEFGYVLDTTVMFDKEKYNDNAENIVYLYPVQEKEVNYAAGFEAVIDNELNILFVYQPTVIGQDLSVLEYIADGLYLTEIEYDENVSVQIFVDGDGKELKKLPDSAIRLNDMWKVGTKYYNLDMTKVLFDSADYDNVNVCDGYVILMKDPTTDDEDEERTDYYYFTSTAQAPVLVSNVDGFESLSCEMNGQCFIIKTKKERTNDDGDPIEITVSKLYNENNELVVTFEKKTIENVVFVGDNLYKVTTRNLETLRTEVVWFAK